MLVMMKCSGNMVSTTISSPAVFYANRKDFRMSSLKSLPSRSGSLSWMSELRFVKGHPRCRVTWSFSSSLRGGGRALRCLNMQMGDVGKVKVRVQLQRECMFGERFSLLGQEECLGSWDPLAAVPMEWSPDHIWTSPLLDLPVGKTIFFKFIMVDEAGEVQWQPGPDRMFETWETSASILVSQDWDSPSPEITIEEDIDEKEPFVEDSYSTTRGITDVGQESPFVDTTLDISNVPRSDADNVPGLITMEKEEKEEKEVITDVPLLVPGLITPANMESFSSEKNNLEILSIDDSQHHKNNDATLNHDKSSPGAELQTTVSSEEDSSKGFESSDVSENEDNATSSESSKELPNGVNDNDAQSVLGNDLEWGRKALFRFIGNLGLKPE